MSEIMVASTSHDMRTPLNTIINMLILLQRKIDDPTLLKMLKAATSSSHLLMFLVNDNLDYFQITSGKFIIKNSLVNIKEILNQCFEYIQTQMDQKEQIKVIDIQDIELESEIYLFDGQRISQVLLNLL